MPTRTQNEILDILNPSGDDSIKTIEAKRYYSKKKKTYYYLLLRDNTPVVHDDAPMWLQRHERNSLLKYSHYENPRTELEDCKNPKITKLDLTNFTEVDQHAPKSVTELQREASKARSTPSPSRRADPPTPRTPPPRPTALSAPGHSAIFWSKHDLCRSPIVVPTGKPSGQSESKTEDAAADSTGPSYADAVKAPPKPAESPPSSLDLSDMEVDMERARRDPDYFWETSQAHRPPKPRR